MDLKTILRKIELKKQFIQILERDLLVMLPYTEKRSRRVDMLTEEIERLGNSAPEKKVSAPSCRT